MYQIAWTISAPLHKLSAADLHRVPIPFVLASSTRASPPSNQSLLRMWFSCFFPVVNSGSVAGWQNCDEKNLSTSKATVSYAALCVRASFLHQRLLRLRMVPTVRSLSSTWHCPNLIWTLSHRRRRNRQFCFGVSHRHNSPEQRMRLSGETAAVLSTLLPRRLN